MLSIPLPRSERTFAVPLAPVWIFWLGTLGFCHAAMVSLDPRRPDVVAAAVLPLGFFALERSLEVLRRRRQGAPWVRTAITAIVALIIPPLTLLAPHAPASHETIREIYEVTGIASGLLLLAWVIAVDRRLAVAFFGAAFVYGMVLENGGIILGFFHETGYRLYIPPFVAPLVTMLGWSVAIFLSCWYTWRLREHAPKLLEGTTACALTATTFALGFDIVVDPVAAVTGMWVWHPTLWEGPLGVPPVNWVAWACAVFPFAWAVFRICPDGVWTDRRLQLVFRAVPVALVVAFVLFTLTSLAWEGRDGPSLALLGEAFRGAGSFVASSE